MKFISTFGFRCTVSVFSLCFLVFSLNSVELYAQETSSGSPNLSTPTESPGESVETSTELSREEAEETENLKELPEIDTGQGLKLGDLPSWGRTQADLSMKKEGVRETAEGRLFGYGYFKLARDRIQKLENQIRTGQADFSGETLPPQGDQTSDALLRRGKFIKGRSALTGFVGPMEMVSSSFYATIPQKYILQPGDVLHGSFWGTSIDPLEVKLVIDDLGYVDVPKIGKVLANGLTLERFQKNLEIMYEKSPYKYMKHMVTLDRLRSIQITITGEAFRPGDYAVSAATTLFNALYACGGISPEGSLRDIRLLRNQQTIHIDFYEYLLHGDNHNNLPLQPGDIIFIPPKNRQVLIKGEVNRPMQYELKESENLPELLSFSGGIKETGIRKRVQIRTVKPNSERVLIDLNLTDQEALKSFTLKDGDAVTVFSVLPEYLNNVTLKGAVDRPGSYEWKKGMRVSDLFSEINQPEGDVFWERADVIRNYDEGKTTELFSFNLKKALNGDPQHNLLLEDQDLVRVYSKWEAMYISDNKVSIYGAVQRPAEYRRVEGMKLRNLIFIAGGLLPGYYDKIEIVRKTPIGTVILTAYADKLFEGDESQNITLNNEDIVMVKRRSEYLEKPLLVTIDGEVKYPGVYALKSRSETISELVKRAGGFTPYAYLRAAVFKRNNDSVSSKEMNEDIRYINEIFKYVNTHEYYRQLARNNYLWAAETGEEPENQLTASETSAAIAQSDTSNATAAKALVAPDIANATGGMAGALVESGMDKPSTVSPPRELGQEELNPKDRIIFDLETAIHRPNSDEDLELRDGDMITIPQKPSTVSVIGAVMRPTTITCVTSETGECDRTEHYIELSGGYNADAAIDRTIVFRVDGSILPVNKVKRLQLGDVVYVPTKPLSTEIITTTDKIMETVRYAIVTLAGYWMIITILAL